LNLFILDWWFCLFPALLGQHLGTSLPSLSNHDQWVCHNLNSTKKIIPSTQIDWKQGVHLALGVSHKNLWHLVTQSIHLSVSLQPDVKISSSLDLRDLDVLRDFLRHSHPLQNQVQAQAQIEAYDINDFQKIHLIENLIQSTRLCQSFQVVRSLSNHLGFSFISMNQAFQCLNQ
jgi:hypothetical protein